MNKTPGWRCKEVDRLFLDIEQFLIGMRKVSAEFSDSEARPVRRNPDW